MKRITAIASFALAIIVSGTAMGQDRKVKATIPFDFAVGNTHVPAGTYTISSTSSQTVFGLSNYSAKINIFGVGHADDKRSSTSELVFDRIGDRYFLREILCTTTDMNMELPVSKTEKRVQLQQASLDGENKDQVVVALNEIR